MSNDIRMSTLPIRVASGLGHIDAHAELLVTIADATGRAVVEDFNGDDLVAEPGESPKSVKSEWSRRRTERQRAWPEADPSYPPTKVPAPSTRHCWLRLRSHKKTGAQRIADDGHVFTTCALCGHHYAMLCPGGCVHDRPA